MVDDPKVEHKRTTWQLLIQAHDFRRLWLAQIVSQLGDWLNHLAQLVVIGRLAGTDTALKVGFLFGLELFLRMMPTAVMGPFAGGLADRLPRRTLMIAADLIRCVVVLGFLLVREPGDLWLLYTLSVLQMSVALFFDASRSGTVAESVHRRDLQTAYALTAATWSTTLALGAWIGGALTERLGTDFVFVLDALTYLASAGLLVRLTIARKPASREPWRLSEALRLKDIKLGWQHATERGVQRAVLSKAAWGGAGGFLCILSISGRVVWGDVFGVAAATGYLFAARGLGTGIGPMITRRLFPDSDNSLRWQITCGFLIGALGYAVFGATTNMPLALGAIAFAHSGGSILWVSGTVLWQRAVDDEFRGRVYALEVFVLTLSFSVSALCSGLLYDRIGRVDQTTWVLCALVVACALLWTLYDRCVHTAPPEPK